MFLVGQAPSIIIKTNVRKKEQVVFCFPSATVRISLLKLRLWLRLRLRLKLKLKDEESGTAWCLGLSDGLYVLLPGLRVTAASLVRKPPRDLNVIYRQQRIKSTDVRSVLFSSVQFSRWRWLLVVFVQPVDMSGYMCIHTLLVGFTPFHISDSAKSKRRNPQT